MPTNVTWNGTVRSVPNAGELNWQTLTDFLVDLGNNAQTTNFQRFGARVALTTPVTVAAATDAIVVSNLTVAGPVAVDLPAGSLGQIFYIVDGKGDALTNPITITPNAGTINGQATFVLQQAYGGCGVVYNGTEWNVFAEFQNSNGVYIPLTQKGAASGVAPLDGSSKLATSFLETNVNNGVAGLDLSGNALFANLPTADANDQVLSTNGSQTLTNKTINIISFDRTNVTIAANTFAMVSNTVMIITAGAGPLNSITGNTGKDFKILVNGTGSDISITDQDGPSGLDGIITGTGAAFILKAGGSVSMYYENATNRWRLIGGNDGTVATTDEFSVNATIDHTFAATAVNKTIYPIDLSTSNLTINLPPGTANARIRFQDATNSFGTNNLTLDGDGAETIDGSATKVLNQNGVDVELAWNGTQWVSNGFPSSTVHTAGAQTVAGAKNFTSNTGFNVSPADAPVHTRVTSNWGAGGGGTELTQIGNNTTPSFFKFEDASNAENSTFFGRMNGGLVHALQTMVNLTSAGNFVFNPYGGNVSVATAGAAGRDVFHSNKQGTTTVGVPAGTFTHQNDFSNQTYIQFYHGAGAAGNVGFNTGSIARNGVANTVQFVAGTSDERTKENIVPMPDQLDKINQIQMKQFDLKAGYGGSAGCCGPTAQQLNTVYPDKVIKTDDGTGTEVPDGTKPWTVGTDFTWELIKSVQELSAKVTALEARVDALENP